MYLWGGISMVLLAVVVGIATRLSGGEVSFDENLFTGASMLSDSVGGYVLTAVAAFAAGVIITMIVRRSIERKHKKQ